MIASCNSFVKLCVHVHVMYKNYNHELYIATYLFLLVIRRGQIVTASKVAAEMVHSPSLLSHSSSSTPVPSGNDQGVQLII